MAEAIADADAGQKRRLPVWMLKANPENEPKKHVEGDRSSSLSEEKPEVKDAGSELNSTARMHRINKPTLSIDSLSKSATDKSSKARQRKRKASRRNVAKNDDSSTANAIAKTSREEDEGGLATVDNGACAETKSRRSKRHKHDEVVCSPVCDDGIELTVEDLVLIAEEFVNADKQKQLGSSIAREHRSSEIPPRTSSGSSGVSTDGSPQVSGLNQALSRCTAIPTPAASASNLYEEKKPESEIPVAKFSQTGDAAQDMLDLLLGPLLKKPQPKEHERRAVNAESMTLTHEPNKPSTISSEVCRDEALPTKRKSSLKDKVAMLLDD